MVFASDFWSLSQVKSTRPPEGEFVFIIVGNKKVSFAGDEHLFKGGVDTGEK
jgi:hypothetical protein